MKLLVISLNNKGLGETIIGLRAANDFAKAKHTCLFLTCESQKSLFNNLPFEVFYLKDQNGPMLKLCVDSLISKYKFDAIILSDGFTFGYYCNYVKIDPHFLFSYNIPIINIDIWNWQKTGLTIDGIDKNFTTINNYIIKTLSMLPVPFLSPFAGCGIYFKNVPPIINVDDSQRDYIRESLNISKKFIILLCTAKWQHPLPENKVRYQAYEIVCNLLNRFLSHINECTIIHIGPDRISQLQLHKNYCYIEPCQPELYQKIVACSDLLLSLNITATTVTHALFNNIPILTLYSSNGNYSKDLNNVSKSNNKLVDEISTEDLLSKLNFKYFMWPIGYFQFLSPVLENNDYFRVVNAVDIKNREQVLEFLIRISTDSSFKEDILSKQKVYTSNVFLLPSPSDALESLLKL